MVAALRTSIHPDVILRWVFSIITFQWDTKVFPPFQHETFSLTRRKTVGTLTLYYEKNTA